MQQTEVMSLHDKLALIVKSIELEKQGKFEEAERVNKQVPIPLHTAKWAKKRLGVDFLIKSGLNWSEAVAEYGPDWLKN